MTKYELGRTGSGTEKTRDYNWDFLKGIGCEMIKEDVCNDEALKDHSNGCDYIIHTAAQPAMTISWEDPRLDFNTNVLGTYNVLDAARKLMPLQRRRAMLVILTNSRDEDQGELARAVNLLSRRHLVVIAQLRERSLDRVLKEPLDDFASALRFQSVSDYLDRRRQGFEALQHQGALILDSLPEKLPVTLVNRYLDIKAKGVL